MAKMRDFRTPRRDTLTTEQIMSKVRNSGATKPVRPVVINCTCGCGKAIPPQRTRSLFLQGHDAKLKSLLIRVLEGQAAPDSIPQEAIDRQEYIGFLKSRPELRALLNRITKP